MSLPAGRPLTLEPSAMEDSMPGGRPKKHEDRRDKIIPIRLTAQEREALHNDASKSGQTDSEYIRSRLYPIIVHNDVPPSGADPGFMMQYDNSDVRVVYVIKNSGLYVTHRYSLGRMTATFGAQREHGKEAVLTNVEQSVVNTVDAHGRHVAVHVDEIVGGPGDSEVEIYGHYGEEHFVIRQYADGRPEEVARLQ